MIYDDKDRPDGKVNIPTYSTYESKELLFRVYVKKDTRTGYKDLIVKIVQGEPPDVVITYVNEFLYSYYYQHHITSTFSLSYLICRPVINSLGKTNMEQKFSVSTTIKNRVPFYTYFYR